MPYNDPSQQSFTPNGNPSGNNQKYKTLVLAGLGMFLLAFVLIMVAIAAQPPMFFYFFDIFLYVAGIACIVTGAVKSKKKNPSENGSGPDTAPNGSGALNAPVANVDMTNRAQFDFKKKREEYLQNSGEEPSEETEAKLFGQAVELQLLKAPAGAKFCDVDQMTVTPLQNGCYKVSGFVDSQNSYGAFVRTSFTLTVFKNENGWNSADRIVLIGRTNPIGMGLIFISFVLDGVAFLIHEPEVLGPMLGVSGVLFLIGLIVMFPKRR